MNYIGLHVCTELISIAKDVFSFDRAQTKNIMDAANKANEPTCMVC